METVQVSKELMKKLHNFIGCASQDRSRLLKEIDSELPELFKQKFEVGKWYKSSTIFNAYFIYRIDSLSNTIISYNNSLENNTISMGSFGVNSIWALNSIPATDKEVENHLIKLAEKKGFKENTKCSCYWADKDITHSNIAGRFIYDKEKDILCIGHNSVYMKGDWATIIEEKPVEYTLEEISELLKDKLNGRKLKIKNFVTCDSNELLSNI